MLTYFVKAAALKKPVVNIFWFRRDLRLEDNAGLYHALRSPRPVVPIFIFDKAILDKLENKSDARVQFIFETLRVLHEQLTHLRSSLEDYYGLPLDVFKKLSEKYRIETVFCNHDYEPYARERDQEVATWLKELGSNFMSFKDQVIFEKNDIVKDNGEAYTVFTPYSKKWHAALDESMMKSFPVENYKDNFYQQPSQKLLELSEIGFQHVTAEFPPANPEDEILTHYKQDRDFPGLDHTSRLGIHLRFGTISIRKLVKKAIGLSAVYLNELIWREFYQMILWHFPAVGNGASFKPAYDRIEWRFDESEFERWCVGKTGYPIVDAGMRQLNQTGFMHNRVRMITASFLCKHLLIDWRLGEAYFAEKLLDYDLASNNGGWQWAAGSGCDATPYFRIFNPYLQTKRFDPQLTYIKRWVPEFQEFDYPLPIVDHAYARARCLEVYSKALKKNG